MDLHAITTQQTLESISRHCPEALSAYIQCLNRADSEGNIFFSRELIEVGMSENYRAFKENIKKLAREGLLEWVPLNNGISATLSPTYEDG